MGWLSAQLGQNDTACRCFLRVLDQNRIEPMAFYGLGLCLALRKEYDAAEQCLKQAISLKPDQAVFHLAGAWLSVKQEQWELATRQAELAAAIHPNNPFVKKACQQIRRVVRANKLKNKIGNSVIYRGLLARLRSFGKILG